MNQGDAFKDLMLTEDKLWLSFETVYYHLIPRVKVVLRSSKLASLQQENKKVLGYSAVKCSCEGFCARAWIPCVREGSAPHLHGHGCRSSTILSDFAILLLYMCT